MQVWSYLYISGALQGCILGLALLKRKVNHESNRILSLWLFLLVFDLIIRSVYLNKPETALLPAYAIAVFLPYLYGGFFYVYIRSLLYKKHLQVFDWVHTAAFFFMLMANITWVINPWQQEPPFSKYYEPFLYLYSISYVVAGIRLTQNYLQELKQQRSGQESQDIIWLKVMAYGQLCIWSIALIQWLSPDSVLNQWFIYAAISLWITLIGYLALTQNSVEYLKPINEDKTSKHHERFPEVRTRLQKLIKKNQIHLQTALTIGQLAKKSGYPEYLISEFINRTHNMSFREYINQLRIQSACEMLTNDRNQNILDIAYTCGFSSKSTFNSAFKRYTLKTPSQFKRKISLNDACNSVETEKVHTKAN